MAHGSALGVELLGWEELWSLVVGVEADLPGGVVDHPVVSSAEQGEVVEAGVAAVGPVVEVVGVAHQWGAGAAGGGAVGVAEDEGAPEGGGDQALGAADVEDLAVGAEDGGMRAASQASRSLSILLCK